MMSIRVFLYVVRISSQVVKSTRTFNWEPLKGFNQGPDLMKLAFREDISSCSMKKESEEHAET